MIAASKNKPSATSSRLRTAKPPEGGIRISITNQYGERQRYHAQAVSLSVRKGVLQIVENDGGCFIWFDQCDLEVRDPRRTLLFRLKSGAASNLRGAELSVLAKFVPPPTKTNAR